MSDYISRETIKDTMLRYGFKAPDMTVTEFVEDELPAADVEPVRHGAWYPCFEDWRQQQEGNKCSVCGFEYTILWIRKICTMGQKLNCHGRPSRMKSDITFMDCWHFIAPLIPVDTDYTMDIYVMVFNALKEAEKKRIAEKKGGTENG